VEEREEGRRKREESARGLLLLFLKPEA